MKYEPPIIHAIELLKEARDICARAGAAKTADKIRLALSSAKGARRNAHAKDFRATLGKPRKMRVADLQRAVDEVTRKAR